MRRKIVPHGPSSLTVSLPSQWVKRHNLKKGGEIDIYEEDNHLLIKPIQAGAGGMPKAVEVSFAGLDSGIWMDMILALHKKGYDEIKINIGNQSKIKELHSYLNSMQLGFEIIKQEANYVFLKNITNPESEEFDTLFRRIFWITQEYSSKIGSVMNNSEDITNSCLLHENSINRLSNYCKRIIAKEKKSDSCFVYSILEDLNNMASSLNSLLDDLKKKESKIPKEFIMKYNEINILLTKIYDLYYKFSLDDYSVAKRSLEALKKQISQSKSFDVNRLGYFDRLETISKYASSLLESMLIVHY